MARGVRTTRPRGATPKLWWCRASGALSSDTGCTSPVTPALKRLSLSSLSQTT